MESQESIRPLLITSLGIGLIAFVVHSYEKALSCRLAFWEPQPGSLYSASR
jgi:hypothetical protein